MCGFLPKLSPLHRSRFAALVAFVALLLFVAACSPEPEVVPVRTLDRPTDLSFVCAQVTPGAATSDVPVLSGRPMRVCRPPDKDTEPAVDLRARTLGTFGFLTNSARNEVAVIDFDRNRVADLDPGNYGFNFLPVGILPEVIATSPDGCRAVTVNRGSCDLSFIDTSRVLRRLFPGTIASTEAEVSPTVEERSAVQTVAIQTASGALRARAGEIQFLPSDTTGQEEARNQCSSQGMRAGAGFVPYRALVTLPGCSLLALVELPSGRLLDSVRVTTTGVVPAGTDPRCPVECRVPIHPLAQVVELDAGTPDGGAFDAASEEEAGGSTPDVDGGRELEPEPGVGILASALALLPDGRRAYVGAVNDPAVFAIDLVGDDLYGMIRLVGSPHGARIPLAEGALGVSRLRLSVDPYAQPKAVGETGAFVAADPSAGTHEFLYAIALDASVRVLDLSKRKQEREKECDTQVDVRALATAELRTRPCHPLSDDPGAERLPRRIFARGPGIRPPPPLVLASDGAVPVPVDIAFGRIIGEIGSTVAPKSPGDSVFDGAFAYILYASGQVMVVNVQPTARKQEQWDGMARPATHRHPITHQPRNFLVGVPELGNNIGPPRVPAAPTVVLTTNDLPFAVRPQLARERWPQLEGVSTSDPELHPLAGNTEQIAYAVFPRADEVSPQRWFITWEGGLPGAGRITGQVLAPPNANPPGTTALLRDPGADFCDSGVMPGDVLRLFGCLDDLECDPGGRMTCVRASAAESGLCFAREKAGVMGERCAPFIKSRRRYQVLEASRTTLKLGLLVEEFARPSIAACQVDEDCRLDAELQAGFVCAELHAGQGRRCIRPCSATMPCRPGFVCAEAGTPARALCVEAPPLDTAEAVACLADTHVYRVLAGQSFLVSSADVPRFPAGREEGGRCVATPTLDSRMQLRISMRAPACIGDGSGSYSALEALKKFPGHPAVALANPCLFRSADRPQTIKALYEGPWMRFVLANLEQPFGDGVSISFSVEGGHYPTYFGLSSNVVAVPMRLVIGPIRAVTAANEAGLRFPYLYMVDAGRAGSGGHRGQLLRGNTRRGQFDSRFGTGRDGFQIQ